MMKIGIKLMFFFESAYDGQYKSCRS